MRFLLLPLLCVSSLALSDEWVPYTDGRMGGCMVGEGGMYACTMQPLPPVEAPEREVVKVPTRDPMQDVQLLRQQQENQQLRQQLNNAQDNARVAEQQRQQAARDAEQNTPEAQAQRQRDQAQEQYKACMNDMDCRCASFGMKVKTEIKRSVGKHGETVYEGQSTCE